MNAKIKTPGLSNPETYVLTHNRFNTYMVLVYSDLDTAQIFKMPYRDSPHHEIEILLCFDYLNLFRPNENKEDYYVKKPNNENFLFEIGDKKYIYVGEKVISFKTNDIIVEYNSEHGYNDMNHPYAYGEENLYFMLHEKYIPTQEFEKSTIKSEYNYSYKRCGELEGSIQVEGEGIVEYGNDFLSCKIIHSKRQIFIKISQNLEYIQTFKIIEEIHFILHVVIGIHITIHSVIIVYLHEFIYKY